MQTPTLFQIAAMVVCLIGGIAAFYARGKIILPDPEDESFKAVKKKRRNLMLLGSVLLWLLSGLFFGLFHREEEALHISIMADQVPLFGSFTASTSVILGWIVIGVVLVLALLARIFAIPKFKEAPGGLQAILETAVGGVDDFVKEKFGHKNPVLGEYMFALAVLYLGAAILELFGQRPPTTDLITTFTYAIVTFVMINYYGVKKKGVGGRLKSFASPNAVIAPFKLLSDIAIPVSLACRLFGNMLGGMIVMHLVYMSLGAFGAGVPAVLGLYFNAFHPIIQIFIFINLSLTFIGEAVE